MVPFAKSARVTLDPPSLDQYGRSLTFASRKTARAQVYMIPNSQALIYVNGRPLESYFTTASERDAVLQGLYPENGLEKWNIWCVVKGGGLAAQAQALKVAIARGRVVHEPEMEETLAESMHYFCIVRYFNAYFVYFKQTVNLLRIDTRQVERKKTGQPKARKKNTWVKR